MKSLHRQRGLSLISLIVTFAFVGFLAVIVMRLIPVYMDDNSIKSAMEAVAAEVPPNASINEVRKRLNKNLEINSVTIVKGADFQLTKDGELNLIYIEYEARTPFVANIEFAVVFEHEVPLGGAANP
jgi:Tfp pilus assembly protein PilE